MKRLTAIFIFLLGLNALSYAQLSEPRDSVGNPERDFLAALDTLSIEECEQYIDCLSSQDTIAVSTIYIATDCLIKMNKYEKCIEFCDKWGTPYINSDQSGRLHGIKGQCYYRLGDNENAIKYLSLWYQLCDTATLAQNLYLIGLYANALHDVHNYFQADSVFKVFFKVILDKENTSIDELFTSVVHEAYGYYLYRYAYNSIFLGNECEGLKLLEYSAKCGYKLGIEDYERLSNSPTFAKNIKVKNSTISHFMDDIETYDIKSNLPSRLLSNQEYWEFLHKYGSSCCKLQDAYNKKRIPKTLIKAATEINENADNMRYFLLQCYPYNISDYEVQLEKALFGSQNHISDFRIYPANDVNAFATPYGQIYLTDSLIIRFHFNENLILSVCAHEATHYESQHSLIAKWQQLEKERKNEIWGGIVAGLYAGAMVASGVTMAAYGANINNSYWENTTRATLGIIDAFDSNAYYFKFKYSREQEIEADISAYRFCEATGLGGYSYILALELLGDNDFYLKVDKDDDHPATTYRILLLKYLYSLEHPESTYLDEN